MESIRSITMFNWMTQTAILPVPRATWIGSYPIRSKPKPQRTRFRFRRRAVRSSNLRAPPRRVNACRIACR